jgi:hypothetical protein
MATWQIVCTLIAFAFIGCFVIFLIIAAGAKDEDVLPEATRKHAAGGNAPDALEEKAKQVDRLSA